MIRSLACSLVFALLASACSSGASEVVTGDTRQLSPATTADKTTAPRSTLAPSSGPVVGETEWIGIAETPLSARTQSTVAWTGREMLVVGGTTFLCPPSASCIPPEAPPFADAALYDPVADSWRAVPDAPVPVLYGETALLGDAIYLLATTSFEGINPTLLRFDVGTESWSTIALPDPANGLRLVATDTGLVVFPGSNERGATGDKIYNPVDDAWGNLPDDPLGPAFDREYTWNGEALYLFEKALIPQPGGADGPSFARGARFRDGEWEELPQGDLLRTGPWLVDGPRLINPSLGCADGGEVNNFGRCIPHGAVFDTESNAWSELPNDPTRGDKEARSAGGVSSSDLTVTASGRPLFDANTNAWFDLPALGPLDGSVEQRVRTAGPYAFAFGGGSFGPEGPTLLSDGWIVRLR